MNIISLNELTLLRFLWLCWRRQPVHVLIATPLLPPLQGSLDRLVNRLIAAGRTSWAVDLVPELRSTWDYDRRIFFDEAFKKYEPWQNAFFGFEWTDTARAPYGYAYKQIVANYVFTHAKVIYVIDALIRKYPAGSIRFGGIAQDVCQMYRNYFGDESVVNIQPAAEPKILINTVVFLCVLFFGWGWVIRRLRLSVPCRKVFFAFDWINDLRDFFVCDSIRDGGDVLLIYRNDELWKARPPEGDRYMQCRWSEALFPWASGFAALGILARDTLYLWMHLKNRPVRLFYRCIAMPFRRMNIRGFFNVYRPRYMWGRDDYNVEHILRRDELHRVGGKSFGISHAVLSNFCSLIPQWRYISFDRYYTYSNYFCRPYLDTWPRDMEVKSGGVFGLPREKILSDWSCGDGILFSSRVALDEPEFGRMIGAVARAFPHLPIMIQVKRGYISDAQIAERVARWTSGHPNAVYTTEPIYQLMERARYYISDISTVIGEALILGAKVFFADVIKQEFSIFREFPGLSIKTAEELVTRLKGLEAGTEIYPHRQYGELMNIRRAATLYDILREDVGLPPLAGRVGVSESHGN